MIRLNKIFGKKVAGKPEATEDQETSAPAPDEQAFAAQLRRAVALNDPIVPPPLAKAMQVGYGPDPADEDWNEGLADDFPAQLTFGQRRPHMPDVSIPPMPEIVGFEPLPEQPTFELSPGQRAALAQQQLAAARLQTPPPAESPPAAGLPVDLTQVDLPDMSRIGRRGGRVKTRLLGFEPAQDLTQDPITAAKDAAVPAQDRCPTGWIIVTKGPGRGAFFALFNGVSQVGRGDDQAIKLDFGDNSISRSNHAAIAYDDEMNGFFLGHGGKANIIRLNDRPVVSTEPLHHQDMIRIGETTLMFVALCHGSFRWTPEHDGSDRLG